MITQNIFRITNCWLLGAAFLGLLALSACAIEPVGGVAVVGPPVVVVGGPEVVMPAVVVVGGGRREYRR